MRTPRTHSPTGNLRGNETQKMGFYFLLPSKVLLSSILTYARHHFSLSSSKPLSPAWTVQPLAIPKPIQFNTHLGTLATCQDLCHGPLGDRMDNALSTVQDSPSDKGEGTDETLAISLSDKVRQMLSPAALVHRGQEQCLPLYLPAQSRSQYVFVV